MSESKYYEIDGKKYEIVSVQDYVSELKSKYIILKAERCGCLLIRKGLIGEKIPVYDSNGICIGSEEFTDAHNWIVTCADADGNVLVDKYGHADVYQISGDVLRAKYNVDDMTDHIVKPKNNTQLFIQIDKNIAILVQDNSVKYHVFDKNDYLNITDQNNIYGVKADKFIACYDIVV